MTSWKREAPLKRFDQRDRQSAQLDQRFANDTVLFAKSYAETVSPLHDLVSVLSQIGLILTANKRVGRTNKLLDVHLAQTPI